MKNVVLAVSCLLCGALVGVVLSATLFFGGFNFPGTQSVQTSTLTDDQASSTLPELKSQKIEPILARNAAKLSTSAEQIEVPQVITLPDSLQLDNLGAVHPQSSIAEQQQVLSLIASASLKELNQAMANIPKESNRMHEYHWVIGLIAQRRIELDPVGTLQEIDQLISQQEGQQHDNMASYLLIENYARMHPESIIEWLGSLPDNVVQSEQLVTIYSALAESAPESAMELFMRNNSLTSNRYGGPGMILYTWADKDPLAALQWLERNGDQQLLDQHAESMVSMLASRDPEAARTVAARFPELISEDMFVFQEIQTLAESDPLAAIEMTASLSDSGELDSAMHMIFSIWSSKDPIAAFEQVESMADTNKRKMLAYSVGESLASLASRSPAKRQELLSWSESLPPGLQMTVRDPILSEWASYDPQAAIDWLNAQGGWAENPRLVQSVAWNLPEHDIDLALEVYASVDPETQMALSEGIVSKLYQDNPQSAWNWYEGLPENDVKQFSLLGLVMMTARENPNEALDLVSSIDDGGNPEMITGVIQALSFEFPEEVDSWLATANINEQRKTELREMTAQIRREMSGLPMHDGFGGYPPGPAYSPYNESVFGTRNALEPAW